MHQRQASFVNEEQQPPTNSTYELSTHHRRVGSIGSRHHSPFGSTVIQTEGQTSATSPTTSIIVFHPTHQRQGSSTSEGTIVQVEDRTPLGSPTTNNRMFLTIPSDKFQRLQDDRSDSHTLLAIASATITVLIGGLIVNTNFEDPPVGNSVLIVFGCVELAFVLPYLIYQKCSNR